MVKLSNSPIVKVCGMRDAENIIAIDGLSVDLMGFIFWPKSRRYVSERPSYLPTHCKRVGVFVDATIDEIRQKAEEYRLDFVQLHGHETPELISHLSLLTPHFSLIVIAWLCARRLASWFSMSLPSWHSPLCPMPCFSLLRVSCSRRLSAGLWCQSYRSGCCLPLLSTVGRQDAFLLLPMSLLRWLTAFSRLPRFSSFTSWPFSSMRP